MRLMKSIYSMKQAGHIWNQTFDSAVTEWGFKRVPSDWCMYHRNTDTGTVIFAVHVDDIFSIANPPEENAHFKEQLCSKWEISDLGPAKFALGIAIDHDLDRHTIGLSQVAFIDRLIKRFNLSDACPVDTPMIQGLQIRRPDKSLPASPDLEKANWNEWSYHMCNTAQRCSFHHCLLMLAKGLCSGAQCKFEKEVGNTLECNWCCPCLEIRSKVSVMSPIIRQCAGGVRSESETGERSRRCPRSMSSSSSCSASPTQAQLECALSVPRVPRCCVRPSSPPDSTTPPDE